MQHTREGWKAKGATGVDDGEDAAREDLGRAEGPARLLAGIIPESVELEMQLWGGGAETREIEQSKSTGCG